MKTGNDVWACSACRSLNGKRSDRCYRCFTPRTELGMAPTALPTVGPSAPPPVSTRFRSSHVRALLLSMAVVMLMISTGAVWWLIHEASQAISAGSDDVAGVILDEGRPILIWWLVSTGVALLLYAAWISRVVENLPALGAGYSRVSPRIAFLEPLIIGYNVISLPARVGEVLRRIDRPGRGQGLVAAIFFALVGPLLVIALFTRLTFLFTSRTDRLANITTIGLVGFGVQAVGFLLIIVLIWHVERRCRQRYEEMPPPATASPAPLSVTAA